MVATCSCSETGRLLPFYEGRGRKRLYRILCAEEDLLDLLDRSLGVSTREARQVGVFSWYFVVRYTAY